MQAFVELQYTSTKFLLTCIGVSLDQITRRKTIPYAYVIL